MTNLQQIGEYEFLCILKLSSILTRPNQSPYLFFIKIEKKKKKDVSTPFTDVNLNSADPDQASNKTSRLTCVYTISVG